MFWREFVCDKCNCTSKGSSTKTKEVLKNIAVAEGWYISKDKDLCPNCRLEEGK